MPRKGDIDVSKYKKDDIIEIDNDTVIDTDKGIITKTTTTKTVRSRLKASEKYDKESVDNIRLRVPKGWNDIMKDYVKSSGKYASVNSMINELIKNELTAEGFKLPEGKKD